MVTPLASLILEDPFGESLFCALLAARKVEELNSHLALLCVQWEHGWLRSHLILRLLHDSHESAGLRRFRGASVDIFGYLSAVLLIHGAYSGGIVVDGHDLHVRGQTRKGRRKDQRHSDQGKAWFYLRSRTWKREKRVIVFINIIEMLPGSNPDGPFFAFEV